MRRSVVPDGASRRAFVWGVVFTLIGALMLGLGAGGDPRLVMSAYLAAYTTSMGVAVGALIWVQIAHATGGAWLIAFRRQLENVMAVLPLLVVMTLPILAERAWLYPWTHEPAPPGVAGGVPAFQTVVASTPAMISHVILELLVFVVPAELLRHWSRKNDRVSSPELVRRQRLLGGGALPFVGLAFTMFAFDFVMTENHGFRSTTFGLYMFGGGAIGALSLAAVLGELARRAHMLPKEIGVSQFFALGKMLLAMLIFWAYIAFTQLLIIWIADLPEEVAFYDVRRTGTWAVVCWVLAIGHFAVPFAFLLSRSAKRVPALMALFGAYMLAMHWVDVSWLTIPVLRPGGPFPTFADFGAMFLVGGLLVAFGAVRARGAAAFAASDPRLGRALAFEDT